MIESCLYGVWTYRSFFNQTKAVKSLGDLLLAEAEMVFETALGGGIQGQLAFRSQPPKKSDARLTLKGSLQKGAPATVRFQGIGVEGTDASGWIYDYIAYLIPDWPNERGQAAALAGSVIRTVPHAGGGGVRPAGAVYSFVAVQRDFLEPRDVIPLPGYILKMLASRHHRLHHLVWHGTRNMWVKLSPSKRRAIAALGWAPRQPARHADGTPCVDNGSGEDFLFMHRQMLDEVNSRMKKADKPIKAWPSIPAPSALIDAEPPSGLVGNPDGFTVPPTWIDSHDQDLSHRLAALKSDEFYWTRMMWWDRQFKNPQYLRTLRLGELGSLLEFSVHNDMHMRWSSITRDTTDGTLVPDGRNPWDITTRWDVLIYDNLSDFYSSHVNPVFWRLHGWVNDRINDWFAAHEEAHPGEVRRNKVDNTSWFEVGRWVSAADPWTGPRTMPHGAISGMKGMNQDIKKMEKVVAILYGKAGGAPSKPKVAASYGATWHLRARF
jgi:hypothetical protein